MQYSLSANTGYCSAISTYSQPGKQKAPRRALSINQPEIRSEAVIHIELDRMSSHAQARDILHLELNVCIDHVVTEHTPSGKEFAVLVQALQRLIQ